MLRLLFCILLLAGVAQAQPPLHKAAYQGQKDKLRSLIRKGAKPNEKDPSKGGTPLHWAALGGRLETVQLLLVSGGSALALDHNADLPADWAYDKEIRQTLQRAQNLQLYRLVQQDETESLRPVLAARRDLANTRPFGPAEYTLLHLARSADMVKLLLDAGADMKARASPVGDGSVELQSPLHSQAFGGYAGAVREMLARGMPVDDRAWGNVTALHRAALRCQTETMKVLLDGGADVNAVTDNRASALHLTLLQSGLIARRGIQEDEICRAVALLLSRKADKNARNASGITPLQLARENKYDKAAALLAGR